MTNQSSQLSDLPIAEPRPLGLAVAELPILYAKALVPPYTKTFEMEGRRASWGIVWIQILVLIIIPGWAVGSRSSAGWEQDKALAGKVLAV